MYKLGEEVHVSTSEASGGAAPQGVRYVLAVSLLLAIVLLSALWIGTALWG